MNTTTRIYVKVSFIYNELPIAVELSSESLDALDNLKWVIDRIVEWVDEVTAKVIKADST